MLNVASLVALSAALAGRARKRAGEQAETMPMTAILIHFGSV